MLTEKEKDELAGSIDQGYIKIWNFLRRFRLTYEEREEITQETMITAWRRLDELQDVDKLDAWMRQIARNKVYDHWRIKKREETRVCLCSDLVARVQSGEEAEQLICSDVFREIMALGRPANQILLLHDIWKESYQQIAMALSMNPNTVRSIAARSHRKLRRKFSLHITFGNKTQ